MPQSDYLEDTQPRRFNKSGEKYLGEVAMVGSAGNVSNDVDDLELLKSRAAGVSREELQHASGWALREKTVSESLVQIHTPGIDAHTKRMAKIALARFYSFDLWKLDKVKSDLARLKNEEKKWEQLVEQHSNDWGPEVTEWGTDLYLKPNGPHDW